MRIVSALLIRPTHADKYSAFSRGSEFFSNKIDPGRQPRVSEKYSFQRSELSDVIIVVDLVTGFRIFVLCVLVIEQRRFSQRSDLIFNRLHSIVSIFALHHFLNIYMSVILQH